MGIWPVMNAVKRQALYGGDVYDFTAYILIYKENPLCQLSGRESLMAGYIFTFSSAGFGNSLPINRRGSG